MIGVAAERERHGDAPLRDFQIGAHREIGCDVRRRRYRLDAPDRRSDIALALRIGRVLLIEHHALRDGGDRPGVLGRCGRLCIALRRGLADTVGDLRLGRCGIARLGRGRAHARNQRADAVALPVGRGAKRQSGDETAAAHQFGSV